MVVALVDAHADNYSANDNCKDNCHGAYCCDVHDCDEQTVMMFTVIFLQPQSPVVEVFL